MNFFHWYLLSFGSKLFHYLRTGSIVWFSIFEFEWSKSFASNCYINSSVIHPMKFWLIFILDLAQFRATRCGVFATVISALHSLAIVPSRKGCCSSEGGPPVAALQSNKFSGRYRDNRHQQVPRNQQCYLCRLSQQHFASETQWILHRCQHLGLFFQVIIFWSVMNEFKRIIIKSCETNVSIRLIVAMKFETHSSWYYAKSRE